MGGNISWTFGFDCTYYILLKNSKASHMVVKRPLMDYNTHTLAIPVLSFTALG